MLNTDHETSSQDIPVLMDFGSMGPARMDIKGIAEAQALQVFLYNNPSCCHFFF